MPDVSRIAMTTSPMVLNTFEAFDSSVIDVTSESEMLIVPWDIMVALLHPVSAKYGIVHTCISLIPKLSDCLPVYADLSRT